MTVTRIGAGVYRVESEGRFETVYVAGGPDKPWAFWNGQIFAGAPAETPTSGRAGRRDREERLFAPMPATVLKVLVQPGATVVKGGVVVILEAMKMELPVRSPANATVKAIHCREGELVQADMTLVELEADV
jgi:3-methylcrotonyl-CoA carboxylase alpha subunit